MSIFGSGSVGAGLQSNFSIVRLGATIHGGVTVTITSSDPSKIVLSPNAVTVGTESIQLFVANGFTDTAGYFIQGVEDASPLPSTVEITATAPGFIDDTTTATVVQPAMRIASLSTSNSSLSPDDPFVVQIGIPNSNDSTLSQTQDIRPGGNPLTVTITNSNQGIGQLAREVAGQREVGQEFMLTIPVGKSTTPANVAAGGIAFDPLTSGDTTVTAAIAGLIATDAASVDIGISP